MQNKFTNPENITLNIVIKNEALIVVYFGCNGMSRNRAIQEFADFYHNIIEKEKEKHIKYFIIPDNNLDMGSIKMECINKGDFNNKEYGDIIDKLEKIQSRFLE